MAKLKVKRVLLVCNKCREKYNEGEKGWVKVTAKDAFNFWLSGREQWEVVSAECPDCEKKRKEEEL